MEPNQSDTVEVSVQGMDCANCALGIERKLRGLGAEEVSVNFASSTARFVAPADQRSKLISAIESMGYSIGSKSESEREESTGLWSVEVKTLIAALFTAPLLLHMLFDSPLLHNAITQLVLSTPVFLIGLEHFGKSAFRSLRAGIPNMDVLIIIGVVAGYIYSILGLILGLGHNFVFFESSAAIVTFVLIGNLIEHRSVRRTTSAIEELSRLQASTAKKIIQENGEERIEEVSAEAISVGDRILLNSGDKVPADGALYWGSGAFDESMISGESLPAEKGIADKVIGGTILSSGTVKMEATAVGEETVLSGIVRLVKDAQMNRPKIQRLGDQVSAIFVPIVVVISIATLGIATLILGVSFQEGLLRSIAVLVVACPCAMGLATPTAVMVGVGRAAKNGILIKGGETLERFASIKTIIFDKTGTITTGKFKVTRFEVLSGGESDAKALIVALEQHSSHPIARSLTLEFANTVPAALTDIREDRGSGVSGRDSKGRLIQFGARKLSVSKDADQFDLVLVVDGELYAGIKIGDDIKDNAKSVIEDLSRYGVNPVLLSGDRKEKVEAVAKEISINTFYGEKMPEEKIAILKRFEAESETAFVGDGINDAPSLAQASVGISLSNATHVAIQSSRIVLLNGNLSHLRTAFQLSRLTLRTIKQNLFWAFFYNILAIPLAACGYLTPAVAALAMGLSDVFVIGNSLRLKVRRIG